MRCSLERGASPLQEVDTACSGGRGTGGTAVLHLFQHPCPQVTTLPLPQASTPQLHSLGPQRPAIPAASLWCCPRCDLWHTCEYSRERLTGHSTEGLGPHEPDLQVPSNTLKSGLSGAQWRRGMLHRRCQRTFCVTSGKFMPLCPSHPPF